MLRYELVIKVVEYHVGWLIPFLSTFIPQPLPHNLPPLVTYPIIQEWVCQPPLQVSKSQCGKSGIFLPIRFSVKSILEWVLESFCVFCQFRSSEFCSFGTFHTSKSAKSSKTQNSEPLKTQKWQISNFWKHHNWFYVKYERKENQIRIAQLQCKIIWQFFYIYNFTYIIVIWYLRLSRLFWRIFVTIQLALQTSQNISGYQILREINFDSSK